MLILPFIGAPEGGMTKAAVLDILTGHEDKVQAVESSQKWSRGWSTFKVGPFRNGG